MTTTEVRLSEPKLASEHLMEPLLLFADNGRHVDPKEGIARYGPRSLRDPAHPTNIRVGIIGTPESIDAARRWLAMVAKGLPGDERHPEFPGFERDRGFYGRVEMADDWNETITQSEISAVVAERRSQHRFEAGLALLEEKTALIAERDEPMTYVLVALPPVLYQQCRALDYRVGGGIVHRDLRRAYKARVMRHGIPTQFLRRPLAEGTEKDLPSKMAWNFATALYFKAGGVPWGPTTLTPGSLYLGISFFHPLGTSGALTQASLVQAFDEHGEGLILRGREFEWDPARSGSRAPHLTSDQAADLVRLALARYERELKQSPRRVVIHKTSRYWDEERDGFREGLRGRVHGFDLLALEPQSDIRLFAESKYPPLRGTRFRLGELDLLYTNGFLSELGEYHAMAVPSPLLVADHVGSDTDRRQLLREVLVLTKMNWNSARLGGALPITLRFSRLFGEIMKELPPGSEEPRPQFKFYM